MPKFQLHDTVALKRDSTFIGDIERTSQWDQEPLADITIILHTEVPSNLLDQFLDTGAPPPGYVFVEFASQEKGSSLVAEDDLYLINRDLEVGDIVKKHGSQMTGNVIDVSTTYTLDPVWEPRLSVEFGAKPAYRCLAPEEAENLKPYLLNPDIRHPHPQRLIPNVPFEELKRAQDFIDGDYIVEFEWLGHVDGVALMVVIILENNSVVIVAEPDELYIPIPEYSVPVISVNEAEGIIRPPSVSSRPGWGQTILPEDLECGQFVVTDHRNVMNGRWLKGSYDPKVKPEGHVLMVRCRQLGINWLICNAYAPRHKTEPLPAEVSPYENLNLFYAPQEIRRDKRLTLYDPSRPARRKEDRTRSGMRQAQAPIEKNPEPVTLSSAFSIGQRVKFRDAAGAAMKYQGQAINGEVYGRFARIIPSETLGYDLNEFEVIYSQQEVRVRWQDGTITQHSSVDLDKYALFEADLAPSDIVVARNDLKMRQQRAKNEDYSAQEHPLVDFNEMAFFESPHDLLAVKVGIIQNVNPAERLAQIRWYRNPSIWITMYGNALGGSSRFGPISDTIEDVSLYEVMTFNGLMRRLREIVVIPPSSPCDVAMDLLGDVQPSELVTINASLTTLSQMDGLHTSAAMEWMLHNAYNTREAMSASRLIDIENYKPHRSVDWVGEICELRTDGNVVVRVSSWDQGVDVVIEHDQLLAVIDELGLGDIDHLDDPMDIDGDSDSRLSQSSNESVLSETVEYEGGQRIDDDSGDENWESEDETEKTADRTKNLTSITTSPTDQLIDISIPSHRNDGGDHPTRPATQENNARLTTDESDRAHSTFSKQSLASYLPEAEPPAFLSLERDPPSDQFRADREPSTNTTFLKRIAKEHRILSTSLPHREIYVRTYDSRLDLLRCLIIGPADTPYDHAPFLIDLHLGPLFPRAPPTAHFHSWTSGLGRINPNLYEEGKICLSLLGTWPGKSETEGWTEKATILQLLVSLQGLVFVKAPFYNEAGFEGYENTKEYTNESLHYSEKAYVMGRNFVKHALSSPVGGMEDVLAWTYLPRIRDHGGQPATLWNDESGLLKRVMLRSQALMDRSEEFRGPSKQLGGDDDVDRLVSGDGSGEDETKIFMRPLSKGATVMLKRTLKALEDLSAHEILAMVAPPKLIREVEDRGISKDASEPQVKKEDAEMR